MELSSLNLRRIASTPQGGDRRDWPRNLWRDRDIKLGVSHPDSYGRLAWDMPAPTITTKCASYSNGRNGHPEQDRGITLREAARLQSFPDDFAFTGSIAERARQIGNAVPPALASAVARALIAHIEACRAV